LSVDLLLIENDDDGANKRKFVVLGGGRAVPLDTGLVQSDEKRHDNHYPTSSLTPSASLNKQQANNNTPTQPTSKDEQGSPWL
jgi:hypothetical protein